MLWLLQENTIEGCSLAAVRICSGAQPEVHDNRLLGGMSQVTASSFNIPKQKKSIHRILHLVMQHCIAPELSVSGAGRALRG